MRPEYCATKSCQASTEPAAICRARSRSRASSPGPTFMMARFPRGIGAKRIAHPGRRCERMDAAATVRTELSFYGTFRSFPLSPPQQRPRNGGAVVQSSMAPHVRRALAARLVILVTLFSACRSNHSEELLRLVPKLDPEMARHSRWRRPGGVSVATQLSAAVGKSAVPCTSCARRLPRAGSKTSCGSKRLSHRRPDVSSRPEHGSPATNPSNGPIRHTSGARLRRGSETVALICANNAVDPFRIRRASSRKATRDHRAVPPLF
jgi:hypothetical protein